MRLKASTRALSSSRLTGANAHRQIALGHPPRGACQRSQRLGQAPREGVGQGGGAGDAEHERQAQRAIQVAEHGLHLALA